MEHQDFSISMKCIDYMRARLPRMVVVENVVGWAMRRQGDDMSVEQYICQHAAEFGYQGQSRAPDPGSSITQEVLTQ